MALRFTANHQIHFGTGSLLVEARDKGERVVCRISTVALQDKGGAASTEAAALWRAYRRIARQVREAANWKYAQGDIEPDGSVFVDSADLD